MSVGPTPVVWQDGQWVPSPFSRPDPPRAFVPAPPQPTFTQPTFSQPTFSQPTFSHPASPPQQPLYGSGGNQGLRNVEVGAVVWSAYQLDQIRQAQQQSVAIQRESLRLQRAQTMLMGGWTWRQVEEQFAWEEAQRAAADAAAAALFRKRVWFLFRLTCMAFAGRGSWLFLAGRFHTGAGSGAYRPATLTACLMAVGTWMLVASGWRVIRRVRRYSGKEVARPGHHAASRPGGPGSAPKPSPPAQPPKTDAQRRREEWDRSVEELRERQRRKSESRRSKGGAGPPTAPDRPRGQL